MIEPSEGRLRALLTKHEGRWKSLYMDCCRKSWRQCVCARKGNLTGGVGFNFDDCDLPDLVIDLLLTIRMDIATKEAASFAWFNSIGVVRQDVVISMIYNMGLGRFMGFKRMIAWLSVQQYEKAAEEMLDSEWANQVGDGPGGRFDRAEELARMMRTGMYVGG